MAYRLTQGDFQARFDAHGRLTHLGHPDRIKQQPTCFHLTGPIREGHWYVNYGDHDIFFDLEETKRDYDFDAGVLTLKNEFRDPCVWWGFNFTRSYRIDHGLLRCDFTLENWSPGGSENQIDAADCRVTSAMPVRRLRYCTGVNSFTDFSSDWAHRPFPTNMRVEQDFFWAGMVSTAHDVIGYFTTGKVDGWQAWYEGHGSQRIHTACIDFVNSLDLHPTRYPHQAIVLNRMNPRYNGAFYIGRFDSLEELWQKTSDVLGVAFLNTERCSGFVGEKLVFPVIAPAGKILRAKIYDETTSELLRTVEVKGRLELSLDGKTGRKIIELDAGGWSTEARVWQQEDWAQTLLAAGRHAARVKMATGHNYETMLGTITIIQAAGLLGDNVCRARARQVIEEAFTDHYDRETGRSKNQHHRLQNYGNLLDVIRIYNQYFNSTEYLEVGQKSAKQLMSLQKYDGYFYCHNNIYNNVGHPVKSLFDWSEHLRSHGLTAIADEARASAERAYRSLARAGDDSMTEGSDHFEDGMTACAGYQIASLWPHFGRASEHLAMARGIFQRRRMLKPRVPDSRIFAGTLRHWETYWAMGLGQCMLGGHGWACWSAQFSHALFMATGEWRYLLDSYSTVANCLQSIDLETGDFHFGFAVDPHWNDFFGLGSQHRGEEYIPVPDEIRQSCEAHQVFITLEESFYHRAYLRLGKEGIAAFNGKIITASGGRVDLHSYALDPREVVVALEEGTLPEITVDGKPAVVIVAGERPVATN